MLLEHRTIDLLGKKVFEKAVVTPPFKNPNPLPNEACFLYVLEGENNSYSEEELLVIEQHEGVLMKCGNYMYDGIADTTSGQFGMVAIHFHPDILKQLYEKEIPIFMKNREVQAYSVNMTKVEADVTIQNYMKSLLFYFENPGLVTQELLTLKLKEIILLLLNTKDAPIIMEIMNNLFSPKSFSLKEVVEAHILSPLSIGELAQLSNRSLASFNREFRKVYNDSPANYIKNRRLEKASELLLASNETISAIAYDCNFNDMAHFSSSFKAKFNLTPSEYRLSKKR